MKNLTALLAEVDHVGEVARLLFPFKEDSRGEIGRAELIELANRTAGNSYRYPRGVPALRLAVSLGLVRLNRNLISLTSSGKHFVSRPFGQLTDLNLRQGKLVLALLLDDNQFRESIRKALTYFQNRSSGEERPNKPGNDILRLLQQLGAVTLKKGEVEVNADFKEILRMDYEEPPVGLSESELLKQLERQRIQARAAEDFVVRTERQRLIQEGHPDLGKLVSRISSKNVSAGYDIISFDHDGSHRYIEVKSSVGRKMYFIWSRSERRRAKELGGQYWIYFVPFSYSLPKSLAPIVTIQHPISFIRSGQLIEQPVNWMVLEKEATQLTSESASGTPILLSWPSMTEIGLVFESKS